MDGIIFKIQRGCINDGPGIRTVVYLKGCPLSCVWCHNPESHKLCPQLFYHARNCKNCGWCVVNCPNKCHVLKDNIHVFHRENCSVCGKCINDLCTALEIVGEKTDVETVIKRVLEDNIFYLHSGGGLTLSGGEPTSQMDFAIEILKKAKLNGIHTCLETSGFCETNRFAEFVNYVDLFLFDYKETNPQKHRDYTGATNELILKNLNKIDDLGASIILRCPIIPGLNDSPEHFSGIANTANSLCGIKEIHIEPYHPFGKEKYDDLGLSYDMKTEIPCDETVGHWIFEIQKKTNIKVQIAN